MSDHELAWTALLAAAVATEVHALRYANPHGTLSAFLRSRSGCTSSTARRTLVLACLGWLTAHLLDAT